MHSVLLVLILLLCIFISHYSYGQTIWLYSDCKYSFHVELLLDYNQGESTLKQKNEGSSSIYIYFFKCNNSHSKTSFSYLLVFLNHSSH